MHTHFSEYAWLKCSCSTLSTFEPSLRAEKMEGCSCDGGKARSSAVVIMNVSQKTVSNEFRRL